jgi:hypothetical protein
MGRSKRGSNRTMEQEERMRFLKQVFCKHEYEKEEIKGGFIVEDGWLVVPYRYKCKKCGKVRAADG